MSNLVFVDVETTGTDLSRHHVWEIGLVVVPDSGEQHYCWQIRPDLSTADPMALKVGRYYERIRDGRAEVGAAFRVEHPERDLPEIFELWKVAQAAKKEGR